MWIIRLFVHTLFSSSVEMWPLIIGNYSHMNSTMQIYNGGWRKVLPSYCFDAAKAPYLPAQMFFFMFHVFALACALRIFNSNLAPCPYALARIFRAYLGHANRCKTTNLTTFYTKLLCIVLGGPLGSSASAQLSRPQDLTVFTCSAQSPACCRLKDMSLPKPTRLSCIQFLNSCSFSQPQSQKLSSCIAHLFKDKLDLSHTGIFLARVQNLINLFQVQGRATYPDKRTASCMCFPALADCWVIT